MGPPPLWISCVRDLTFTIALIARLLCAADEASTLDTAAIAAGVGRTGQAMDGGIYRVRFPLTDLDDRVGS